MTNVVDALVAALPEIVLQPGDTGYQTATSPDNSSYPQRPCAVVRPRSAEDVARAVSLVATRRIPIAVQSSGHGAAQPIEEDTVLIDTSTLNTVTVDAAARTATIGAGTAWAAVQRAAYAHKLLGLSGTSPSVGVAGYTFGGGVGWFVRQYGLASGSLLSVQYVDSAGNIGQASVDAADPVDREALWAFRGGAPVAIATSITIALFPIPDLWTGYLLWPASDLPGIAAAWGEAIDGSDDAVTSSLSLLRLPPDGPFPDELLGMTAVHLSYAAVSGKAPLENIRRALVDIAAPTVDTTGPGDVETLSAIHLDPPTAVPARGIGRWLNSAAVERLTAIFDAAAVGQSDGLNMIELRHTASHTSGPAGLHTQVPAPFLLHAVGAAPNQAARQRADITLKAVLDAAQSVDTQRSALTFNEGNPTAAETFSTGDITRLRSIRDKLDPDRHFRFQRDPLA